jgi:hypothetical protein
MKPLSRSNPASLLMELLGLALTFRALRPVRAGGIQGRACDAADNR